MLTQDLTNMTNWQAVSGRWLNYIDHHYLAWIGVKRFIARDKNILADTRIVRANKTDTTFAKVATYQLGCFALYHIHQTAIWAPTTIPASNPYQHYVAIKDSAHLRTGQINILAITLYRRDKAIALRVANHPAFYQVEFIQGPVTATSIAGHLTVSLHGSQAATHSLNLLIISKI